MQEENITAAENTTNAMSSYAILAPPLFSVIIIVGSIGNSLLIYTVLRWREMRTPCNYLIVNNAVADLGMVFIASPLRIIDVYYGWVLGKAACRILVPTQDVFFVVSVITYTLIAWERYRAVVKPFEKKLTLRFITICTIVIWVAAYLSAGLPMALLLSLVKIRGKSQCRPFFASIISRRIYITFLVVFFLLLPLFLQTLAYSRLVHRLRRRNSLSKSSKGIKKRRLVRVTIILILFFHVCVIPRMVMMLIREFACEPVANNSDFKYASLILIALLYVKHVINLIILFSLSSDFRKRFP